MNARILLFRVGCVLLLCFGGVADAADMEIMPFGTFNLSPLVQIHGIPHDTGADIVPSGQFRVSLTQQLTSNYTVSGSPREQITLDGESLRLALALRYGLAPRAEIGVEVPYLVHGGGFLDSFIADWHNMFGLPQGGRDSASKGKFLYSYRKDGVQKLLVDRSGSGVGDIVLNAGLGLLDVREAGGHDTLAVKGSIKLPTGDSSYLFGSGGTDTMLQMCGSMNRFSEWGSLGVYGSVGALLMSKGDVLRDQHKQFAGFGTVGLGWGPAPWISFKVQLDGTTPLYRASALAELSKSPMVLIFGGTLLLPEEYLLDIGVAEDVKVGTAPDVSFHLGVSKRF